MDSFWNVANAVKAAVQQQAADITASLQNTDWKSELAAFQEGFKEDTGELSQRAIHVTEQLGTKTADVAKQLPHMMNEGRRLAVEALPGTGSTTALEAAARFQMAGMSLTKAGQRMVSNTSEIFEQIAASIQRELPATRDLKGHWHFAVKEDTTSVGAKVDSRFNRFDADVATMQRDSSTYCDDPGDTEDFASWAATFNLGDQKQDIARLLSQSTFMSELQSRIVPVVVDYESFWTRYYYRLHKLREKHAKVMALTSKAQGREDNVGWDTDDEDDADEPDRSTLHDLEELAENEKSLTEEANERTTAAPHIAEASEIVETKDWEPGAENSTPEAMDRQEDDSSGQEMPEPVVADLGAVTAGEIHTANNSAVEDATLDNKDELKQELIGAAETVERKDANGRVHSSGDRAGEGNTRQASPLNESDSEWGDVAEWE